MAYDSVSGKIFLFGGFHPTPDNDTWEYTGSTGRWAARAFSGPGVRGRHAMVYDAARNVTLLFGGQDVETSDGPFANDLWQWEAIPRRWTRIAATGPTARYLHAMTFDVTRGVVLLFGGFQADYTYVGDTWSWDGTAWTQLPAAPEPSPRASHTMDFDSGRGVAVLFGGYDGAINRETWEWDGSQWTERDAVFTSALLPDLGARGFVLVEDDSGGIRSASFQLHAGAGGLQAEWTGSSSTLASHEHPSTQRP